MSDETEHDEIRGDGMSYDPTADLMAKIEEMESLNNATFRVYRQLSGPSAKMPFLFEVPADQYTVTSLLEKIKQEYGDPDEKYGDFRIHLRGPTERSQNDLIANKVYSIEMPKKDEPEKNSQSELVPVVQGMMQELREMRQEMRQQPQQQFDPMQMMQSMVSMMGTMHQMMPQPNTAPAPAQKTLVEQMQELKALQEMAGELGGGETSGFSELVKTGLGPMIELVKEDAQARKDAREKGVPYQPRTAPAERQPNPQSETKPGTDTMSALQNADEGTKAMLSNVRTLLAAAQRNGDPETYAEIVLDFVPEEKHVELANFLLLPDCLDTMIQYFPETAQYRSWFEALKNAILSMLPEVDEGDDNGDTSDHADGSDNNEPDGAGHGHAQGPAAGAGRYAQDFADHGEDRAASEGAHADPSPSHGDRQ